MNLENLERNEITNEEVKLLIKISSTRLDVIQEIVNKMSCEDGINTISWTHEKYIKMDNEDTDEEIEH